jgi:predicted acyltransferase
MTDGPFEKAPASAVKNSNSLSTRITSIDALRGLVMFTMIFVNDLHGEGSIVPDWMVHFSDRHSTGSGMTFVDVVFPAFLFVVGMSIPFALGSRLAKGEPVGKIVLHVVTRTLALLFLGIIEVNGTPDSQIMGWSGELWTKLMFLSAILAFSSISPRRNSPKAAEICRTLTTLLRVAGFAGLIYLAFAFRGENDRRIIALSPFSVHTSWWGILGLIGWSYLVASIVFLIFRAHRTALFGCVVLLLCLYPAEKNGAFDHFWLAHYVGLGETLGAHAAITVAGLILASILVSADKLAHQSRLNFTLLFVAGSSAAALLLNGLYGISKNDATPSWCLWSCAITAAFWLGFYYIGDVTSMGTAPLAIAGQNVLLAYLISEMLPSFSRWAGPNLAGAVLLSLGSAFLVLLLTAGLNRRGFRLKL